MQDKMIIKLIHWFSDSNIVSFLQWIIHRHTLFWENKKILGRCGQDLAFIITRGYIILVPSAPDISTNVKNREKQFQNCNGLKLIGNKCEGLQEGLLWFIIFAPVFWRCSYIRIRWNLARIFEGVCFYKD